MAWYSLIASHVEQVTVDMTSKRTISARERACRATIARLVKLVLALGDSAATDSWEPQSVQMPIVLTDQLHLSQCPLDTMDWVVTVVSPIQRFSLAHLVSIAREAFAFPAPKVNIRRQTLPSRSVPPASLAVQVTIALRRTRQPILLQRQHFNLSVRQLAIRTPLNTIASTVHGLGSRRTMRS